MKKFIAAALAALIAAPAALAGCGYKYANLDLRGSYTKELEGTQLNVYNWGEYISDGGDGSVDVNKEFEKLTGIKVKYLTYVSN